MGKSERKGNVKKEMKRSSKNNKNLNAHNETVNTKFEAITMTRKKIRTKCL